MKSYIYNRMQREGVYVGDHGGEQVVVVAKAPTWRDIWAILRGRYVSTLTVERKFEVPPKTPEVDYGHFLWPPDSIVPRTQKVKDCLLGVKPHVTPEVREAYRSDWEAKGRPEPKTALEAHEAAYERGAIVAKRVTRYTDTKPPSDT